MSKFIVLSKTGGISEAFTKKAFIYGAFLSIAIGVGPHYGWMIVQGSWLLSNFANDAAIFLFFALVGFVNVAIKLLQRSTKLSWIGFALSLALITFPASWNLEWRFFSGILLFVFGLVILATYKGWQLSLSREELLVVYVMMIVAAALPIFGVNTLLAIIPGVYYYATPENQWENLLQPYISEWLVPRDSEAIRHFYEGGPSGYGIPWKIWVGPILFWALLLASLYLVVICLMVIFRKQWVRHEKLSYPLAQIPVEMTEGLSPGSLFSSFFKNKIMWIGFAIPFCIGFINGLHAYFPAVPPIRLAVHIPLFRNTVYYHIILGFLSLSLGYLVPTDISFGIWFLNFLTMIEVGMLRMLGISGVESLDYMSSGWTDSIRAHQNMGAMITLVVMTFWLARRHLKGVLIKAFRGDPGIDDSEEMISYRTAVFGVLIGFIIMLIWIWSAGLPFWAALVFLLSFLVILFGQARIVSQGGIIHAFPPISPGSFMVSGFGSSALGNRGLASLVLMYAWAGDTRSTVMTSCAHGLKISENIPGSKRPLVPALAIAIVVTCVSAGFFILKVAYDMGGLNLGYGSLYFYWGAMLPPQFIASRVSNPTGVNWGGWMWTGIGAFLMWILMFARQRLMWWPVHPISLPASGIAGHWSFGMLIACIVKTVILKYGGARSYRKLKPFFIGLAVGYIVAVCMWLVVDSITGMRGNWLTTV